MEGELFKCNDKREIVAACALGAAIHYDRLRKGKSLVDFSVRKFYLKNIEFKGKFVCSHRTHKTLYEYIVHLNDIHKITREKIADIIEKLGY